MKRNNDSVKMARNKAHRNKSRYAEKVKRGQMYGQGCCAHSITSAQVETGKSRARREGLYQPRFERAPQQEKPAGDAYLPPNFDPRPLVVHVGVSS